MTTTIKRDQAAELMITWRDELRITNSSIVKAILALATWYTDFEDLDRGPNYTTFPWPSWTEEIESLVDQRVLRLRSDKLLPGKAPDFDFCPAFWEIADELRDRLVGSEASYSDALNGYCAGQYVSDESLYFTASQPAAEFYAERALNEALQAAQSAEFSAGSTEFAREDAERGRSADAVEQAVHEAELAERNARRKSDEAAALAEVSLKRHATFASYAARARAAALSAHQDLDRTLAASSHFEALNQAA